MVKIGLLLPEVEMVDIAKKLIKKNNIEVSYLKAINTVDTVNEARLAAEAGSHIIIARGYQAKLIKKYTNIPLVEMHFHAQEIGLLIKKAKAIVKKDYPVIGIIAFENMLCDLSHMEELFEVKLVVDYLNKIEDAVSILEKMSDKKPDIIIGGEITCDAAQNMGYLTLFYQSTEESLAEALHTAQNMAFAAESEKQNTAQFETVLDTSFNGIVKVNVEGKVIVINKLVENLIGKNVEEVVGISLECVFPQINMEIVNNILNGDRENYTTSINIRDKSWMLLMAPIQYDDLITGAILSLHKISDNVTRNNKNDMVLHGFNTQTTFQDIHTENNEMKQIIENAKIFALSESPIFIYSPTGTEDYLIAEAIHNNSNRKTGPYVSINIRGIDKEKQIEELFNREAIDTVSNTALKGAMIKANHGTLFIRDIEELTLRAQHQILKTMLSGVIKRTDSQPIDVLDVRIICSSKVNLKLLVEKEKLSEELYYLLQGLTLEIPGLNQRKEDLSYYFSVEMKKYAEKYNKYLVVTEGGYKKILELNWRGNILQLRAFCERLVLSMQKRSVDEMAIQNLFTELYPHIGEINGASRVVIYKSPEGVKLSELLEKHCGNRRLVAEELGISTTTLWRRMKKYGVESKF